ncbi:hypothetical protein ASPWEDRAFT_173345 [Aspergillus wentii DTO 134E9]|uniref:BTB domain transcription factor n=1 Tax=Aspergillus wentii DTO 134E9 TaxID=1073089 RepID=A0A1L9RG53_ASPWE|nr:uncharacterized protein ASPWEDRAFT_173345 [Aspergillus wentii DTO 134E9]KAI9927700.1 hypothetical protein MW887_002552 [Aspergillus wentii]OJJ33912.1 hypothetical protein ASPWEDRAFT_173345 [Aspergillus wentii DTO 134E9]
MAATRTSSRQAATKAKEAIASSADSKKGAAGAKRKVSTVKGPEPKRGKKEDQNASAEEEWSREGVTEPGLEEIPKKEDVKQEETAEPAEEAETKPVTKTPEPVAGVESGVRKSQEREDIVPSNILEKGIIYFFYRPRVNVSDPHDVSDVARSFFVLRPTPLGAVLDGEQGSVEPGANCRLMILPKKKFPTSGRERDMGFVEKSGQSMKDLQEKFLAGGQYVTSTRGERTTQEAKPYAEGVYAITSTQRASHLAYILTIPEKLGDVQDSFGLRHRGSWIVQSKNPKYPGPSYAKLPKDPEYPEHIREKFQDLRWVPLEPEFIDYPNAQFLMIGEAGDGLGKAATAEAGGKQPHEEQPGEELEKMEHENEERIEALQGDDTVYQDLGLDAKNYPKVPSTWNEG